MSDLDDIRAGVLQEIVHVLPELEGDQVSWDSHLRDLGVDSIERVEILQAVVRRFVPGTPIADIAQARTLAELVVMVGERRRD